ncbi:hypothetical protein LTR95_003181 [Oleoguttula sp. CCFEE 5521]
MPLVLPPVLWRYLGGLPSYGHASRRGFSRSSIRKNAVLDAAVAVPTSMLNMLHSTGLPWLATIPIAAFAIRGIAMYYVTGVPARRRAIIRAHLAPLIQARTARELRPIHAKGKARKVNPFAYSFALFTKPLQVAHRTARPYGGASFTWSTVYNIGIFLAFTESIRLKCGTRNGMLGFILAPFQTLLSKVDPVHFPPAPDVIAEKIVARLERAYEQAVATGGDAEQVRFYIDQVQERMPPIVNSDSPYFDASTLVEGFSWCPNLALLDPYYILPVALAASVLANFRVGNARRGPRWFRYSGLTAAALFGYIGSHMPAGIVLYLISSQAAALCQNLVMRRAMPLPPTITRCTRATRSKARSTASRVY